MKTTTIKTTRLRIEGRVQGVGFRAWTRGEARVRGLGGWVRNRRDGAVEAVFYGLPQVVDAMVALCREGPPWAKVARVIDLSGDAGGAPLSPLSMDDVEFSVRDTV